MRRHIDDTDDPFADPADLDDPFAEAPAALADTSALDDTGTADTAAADDLVDVDQPDEVDLDDTVALDDTGLDNTGLDDSDHADSDHTVDTGLDDTGLDDTGLDDTADLDDSGEDQAGRSELEHDLVDPDLVDDAGDADDELVDEPLSILVVCTANICRSPMAEVMLQHALDRVGVDARVSSAGFLARNQPAHRHAASVMRDRGLDVTRHRSRRLTQGLVAQQDLIVTMTREHVRDVVSAWPDATARCYTLASLAEVDTAPVSLDPDDVDAWTRARHERRPANAVLGRGADDIRDPMGKSRRTFAKVADEIGAYCDAIAELLAEVPASRADAEAGDAAFSAA